MCVCDDDDLCLCHFILWVPGRTEPDPEPDPEDDEDLRKKLAGVLVLAWPVITS